MSLPIRWRLTAWYVGLLALIIAALSVFVVVRLRTDRVGDIERSLRSSAAQVETAYERGGAPRFREVSATALRAGPEAESGAQVLGPEGRIALVYGNELPRRGVLSRGELARVMRGGELSRTVRPPPDGDPFLIVARTVRGRDGAQALLVGSSLDGVYAAVNRLMVLLLLAGPAALAATAIGGWWLSGKALRPVARMTAQTDRIEVDRLDERVAVPSVDDEISRLGHTLNRMLDRLRRGVEEKRRLVADASHELRTPLAAMRSELDVALAYERLGPEALAVLESAREEVERMTRIVVNLLTLARADEDRLDLHRVPLSLLDAAAEAAARHERTAAAKRVRLEVEGEAQTVDADADLVGQVLGNLVENAVRHSPEGGTVRLTTWCDRDEAGVAVCDQGPGIPAGELPLVFERFYRVDPSRRRDADSGGSGLGLAICLEIVERHGGRIWAEVAPTGGSSFSFALPRRSRPSLGGGSSANGHGGRGDVQSEPSERWPSG